MKNKINPNDHEEYLNTASMKTTRKMGEKKGSNFKPMYGDGKGEDNKKYKDRGTEGSPDDRKIDAQKLANNRNADYFAGY